MEKDNIQSLTVLRGILDDDLFAAFYAARENEDERYACSLHGKFFCTLYEKHAETDFLAYVCDAILYDENAFSLCCANGKRPSPFLEYAYLRDVKLILGYVAEPCCGQGEYFAAGKPTPMFDTSDGEAFISRIRKFYKKYGCGKFIKYRAFGYEDGELVPVENPSDISLSDLKG